jgi:FkbM family methyltransferase
MLEYYNLALGKIAAFIYEVLPRLKAPIALFFLRLSVTDFVFSIYGVKLKKNWQDATFRFCASGLYGKYFSNFLTTLSVPYSFVDIGANLGLYSLISAKNKFVKGIYAFEPNPLVYRFLVENARLNHADICAYQVAIASDEGTQNFYFDFSHTGTAALTFGGQNKISVPCRNYTNFDEIQSTDKNQKVVKIDVEGYEAVVIKELFKSKMAPSISYIFFEANENQYDISELKEFLEVKGFKLLHKDGNEIHYNLMYSRVV